MTEEQTIHVDLTVVISCPPKYDTERVTDVIGLNPTKIWHPPVELPPSIDHIEWQYCRRLKDCSTLDDAVTIAINLLWDSRTDLLRLFEMDGLTLTICLFPVGWQEQAGMYIEDPISFKRLSTLKARLDFQIEY